MLYFSGTGNSKYVAELFCEYMDSKCYSIEDSIDFDQLIVSEEIIAFSYPIVNSRATRIMREFVKKHISFLKNKKIIIFCTQMLFSGDGSRSFTDLFPNKYIDVIYAEHFIMPNNVYVNKVISLANDKKIKSLIEKTNKKMQIVCRNIKNGIIKKRGFNIISRILGLVQGSFVSIIEKKASNSIKISNDCTNCCICVSICPMKNFVFQNGNIINKYNCTICYRCVNNCPQKAITVLFNWGTKKQYKGLNIKENM